MTGMIKMRGGGTGLLVLVPMFEQRIAKNTLKGVIKVSKLMLFSLRFLICKKINTFHYVLLKIPLFSVLS